MKKKISILLSCVLAFSFALATGCAYNPIQTGGLPTQSESGAGTSGGDTSDSTANPDAEKQKFTVNVVCDEPDENYKVENLKVVWSNRTEAITGNVSSSGVATANLDGDYKVTLQNIPEGYTYNPNIYYVTNRRPTVTVQVYKLNKQMDTGESLYDTIIEVSKTGAYRALIEDRDDTVFFQFQPVLNGYYTIESCVDTTFNEVNPFMDIYFGNVAAKYYERTLDDGSDYCDTYTKNFSYTIKRSQDEVKSVFAFGIRASHKTNQFPTYVDFIISRGEDYERPSSEGKLIMPTEDFGKAQTTITWETGTWTWAENWTSDSKAMFDEDNFILHTDGYYHLKDFTTGGVSDKKLYVMISKSISERPFLNYQESEVNLKVLAECSGPPTDPLKNIGGYKYNSFVIEYSHYTNADGVYPATKEMRDLLQNFAIAQRYFADGQGTFETANRVYAEEDDQWLFACGYYA